MPIKVGVLHPVTGFLAYSGQLCRFGAQLAIDEINAAGGIKSMRGATLEAVLGDAQSKPEVGVSEVEKMNEAGVSAIVGSYASTICLATTQARSEEHTSELQSPCNLVCRLLLEKKKKYVCHIYRPRLSSHSRSTCSLPSSTASALCTRPRRLRLTPLR